MMKNYGYQLSQATVSIRIALNLKRVVDIDKVTVVRVFETDGGLMRRRILTPKTQ